MYERRVSRRRRPGRRSQPPFAQQAPAAPAPPGRQQPQPAGAEPAAARTDRHKYEETVVVSGSRRRGKAGQRAGDDDRHRAARRSRARRRRTSPSCCGPFPGVNITQVSARDINVTSRGATGTLATGQLALLDGRSLYQDFFGFVMWDFLPVNLNEIKQIEVIRGPASAVWGANALNGVVNVITKSPREMQGTSAVARRRRLRRRHRRRRTPASLFYVSGTHAQAVNDRWAFKLSAGGYSQDPLVAPDRHRSPAIAGRLHRAARHAYPALHQHRARRSPSSTARVDYDFDGRRASCRSSGGVAGTDGIMHTGIGPFDINSGSVMGYGQVNFTDKGCACRLLHATSSTATPTTCSRATPTAAPIGFAFNTKTTTSTSPTCRRSRTGTSSPTAATCATTSSICRSRRTAENRTEFGGYVQDEIFLSDHFRLVGRRARSIASTTSTTSCSRRASTLLDQAGSRIRRSASRTTAPTGRRR